MSQRPFLTVLTLPIPSRSRRWYQRARSAIRPLVKPHVPLPSASPYPGHYALTRSVVEGLHAARADFNFNPRQRSLLARVVYAPANEALLQCVSLKRQGAIDYLAAGPVNALHPAECDGLLLHPEIDLLIVASRWVMDLCRADAPELMSKMHVCPCGVDAGWWKPSPARAGEGHVVIYWKSGSEEFCSAVEQVAASRGRATVRIRYGSYARDAYREALQGAAAAIFMSSYETQGLALAEAWAMDVPTLAWDPRGIAEWRGYTFRAGSSAPFLTAETGVLWREVDELGGVLDRALARRHAFRPRAWVLEHMTDEVCARALYRIIHESVRRKAA